MSVVEQTARGNARMLGDQGEHDMKSIMLMTALGVLIAAVAAGQAVSPAPRTDDYAILDGDVVRYEAGQVIVIRGADDRERFYALAPRAVVPGKVTVGGRV